MSEPVLSESVRAMLDEPLSPNLLSARVQRALRDDGVTTLRGLATMSERSVRLMPGVGEASHREMKELLARYGLMFGVKLPPPIEKEPEQQVLPGPEDPFYESDEPATVAVEYVVRNVDFEESFRDLARAFRRSDEKTAVRFHSISMADKPGLALLRCVGRTDSASFARYVQEVLDGKEPSLKLFVFVEDNTLFSGLQMNAVLVCSRDGKSGTLTVQVPITAT